MSFIEQGRLLPLRDWLKTHVHRFGRIYEAEQIVQKATGIGLNAADFIAYLTRKYQALYAIRF